MFTRKGVPLRIIAGQFRGRKLASSSSKGTRPTSGQLREALFNILGPSIEGMEVLELFAGTGAVGLEALSRGAAHVTFVEGGRKALHILRQNIDLLEAQDKTKLVGKEAITTLKNLAGQSQSFDLIFADPPYGEEVRGALLSQHVLDVVDTSRLLKEGGKLFIEETSKAQPLTPGAHLVLKDKRRYGDSNLWEFGYE